MESFEYEDIKTRIMESLMNPTSKLEGSFSMDNVQAVSQEIAMMYAMEVATIPDKVLLDTAYDEFLDRAALDFGEARLPATQAQGTVLFTGNPGTVIPIGTIIKSELFTFATLEKVVINDTSTAEVKAICNTPGTVGNVTAGDISTVDLDGVKVTNIKPFAGGVDTETDEAFRSRIFDRIRNPSTSGNVNDYVKWAKEVPGIGNAVCIPCANGNGTVKVVLLSLEGRAPDEIIIQNAIAHIAEMKPIAAAVSVVAAKAKALSISGNIHLSSGFEINNVTDQFKSAFQLYLATKQFGSSRSLAYFKVSDLLYDIPGVLDVDSYTLNDGTSSITADSDEYFEIAEVSFHAV